jgi:hypothetical protein
VTRKTNHIDSAPPLAVPVSPTRVHLRPAADLLMRAIVLLEPGHHTSIPAYPSSETVERTLDGGAPRHVRVVNAATAPAAPAYRTEGLDPGTPGSRLDGPAKPP